MALRQPDFARLSPLDESGEVEVTPFDRALSTFRAARDVLLRPEVQEWIETDSEIETLTDKDGVEPVAAEEGEAGGGHGHKP